MLLCLLRVGINHCMSLGACAAGLSSGIFRRIFFGVHPGGAPWKVPCVWDDRASRASVDVASRQVGLLMLKPDVGERTTKVFNFMIREVDAFYYIISYTLNMFPSKFFQMFSRLTPAGFGYHAFS